MGGDTTPPARLHWTHDTPREGKNGMTYDTLADTLVDRTRAMAYGPDLYIEPERFLVDICRLEYVELLNYYDINF
jgi:hypothetical protein